MLIAGASANPPAGVRGGCHPSGDTPPSKEGNGASAEAAPAASRQPPASFSVGVGQGVPPAQREAAGSLAHHCQNQLPARGSVETMFGWPTLLRPWNPNNMPATELPPSMADRSQDWAPPRIHVLSDLHLENSGYALPADLQFDILVAAGDIGPVEVAVPWLASIGKPVVYVLGNHEHWDCDIDETLPKAKSLALGTQVSVLENESVVIRGVRFLGTTLWTNYYGGNHKLRLLARSQIRDFTKVRATHRNGDGAGGLVPDSCEELHAEAIEWLQATLKSAFDGPTVVVTHHAPSYKSLLADGIDVNDLDPKQIRSARGDDWLQVACYASNLSDLLRRNRLAIDLWCHGHIHRHIDTLDESVRVLCNPRGRVVGGHPDFYWSDDTGFEPQLVIDLRYGFTRPLSLALKPRINELNEIFSELERFWPVLTDARTLESEAVRKVCCDLLDKAFDLFRDCWGATAKHQTTTAFLNGQGLRFPSDPGEDSVIESYEQQRELLVECLDWFEAPPSLAERGRLQSAAVLARVATELEALDIRGEVSQFDHHDRPWLRWRFVNEFGISVLVELERAERVDEVARHLDTVFNGGKFPRSTTFTVLANGEA